MIPPQISALTKLTVLHLNNNRLEGPAGSFLCIASITAIGELRLQSNPYLSCIETCAYTKAGSSYRDANTPTGSCFYPSEQQRVEANALCSFKLGIANWPSNPTASPTLAPTAGTSASPTSFAPTRFPTASTSASPVFTGWSCNEGIAKSYPCGTSGQVGYTASTGISCSTGIVSQLSLNNRGLKGTISPSISSLTGLTYLYLYGNSLTSSIPSQLSALTGLQQLYLNSNSLSGKGHNASFYI